MKSTTLIAQSLGAAWSSSLNVDTVFAAMGLPGRFGFVTLRGNLSFFESWWAISPVLALNRTDFVADQVPWFDSSWDAVHSFIRVPAPAGLVCSKFANEGTAAWLAALAFSGTLAAESPVPKAGVRTLVNASPNPSPIRPRR